jgi:long-chain acyl-CoA synthetase
VALDYTQYGPLADLEYRNLVEIYHHSIDRFAEHKLFGVKRPIPDESEPIQADQYQWMTYADFGDKVDRFRAALASLGVEPADTVAIISDNRPEWAIAAYATYTLCARWCPMYEAQSEKEWAYILDDSDAKVALVADEAMAQILERMCDDGQISLEHIIYFDRGHPPGGARDKRQASHQENKPENRHSFDALVESDQPAVESREPDGDDICGLIYTSGTTGDPKGVLLSHRNITSNIEAILDFDLIASDDISLSFLPWAHSFGQTAELHCMFAIGASMGLVESIATITDNLQEIRPTILFSVPRIFNRIYSGVWAKLEEEGGLKRTLFEKALKNSERLRRQQQASGTASAPTRLLDRFYDKIIFEKIRQRFGGRLKYAISGGAKLSPEIAYFIDNLHILVCEGYGLTETSPLVSANVPGQRKIGSVGKPVKGVEVKTVPVGQHTDDVGEVLVRGPNVMKGYYKKPEQTDKAIDPDGWFHTGDLGRVDDDGFLWIEGRVKEEFKLANGKYVAPGPLEDKLKLAPHIDQVMIEGQDRPFNIAVITVDQEATRAWAKERGLSTDNLADQPEVRELIEAEVAKQSADFKGYEKPRELIIVDDEWSPENGMLTPTLKLKRRMVVEKYADRIDEIYGEVQED